jgi:hypothetical protein
VGRGINQIGSGIPPSLNPAALGIKLKESETLQADVAYCTDDGGHTHDQAVRSVLVPDSHSLSTAQAAGKHADE